MLNKVLILSLLIGISLQNCNQYCNVCTRSSNQCTTCATIEGVAATPTNGVCQLDNKSDELTTCANNRVLRKDSSTSYTCIDRPTGLNNQCRVSDTASPPVCVYCRSTHYLDSAKACQPVTTPVTNCLYYSSATNCSQCAVGYKLASNACTLNTVACKTVNGSNCDACTATNEYISGSQCLVGVSLLQLGFIFLSLIKLI